jgi:hypothetical protein
LAAASPARSVLIRDASSLRLLLWVPPVHCTGHCTTWGGATVGAPKASASTDGVERFTRKCCPEFDSARRRLRHTASRDGKRSALPARARTCAAATPSIPRRRASTSRTWSVPSRAHAGCARDRARPPRPRRSAGIQPHCGSDSDRTLSSDQNRIVRTGTPERRASCPIVNRAVAAGFPRSRCGHGDQPEPSSA